MNYKDYNDYELLSYVEEHNEDAKEFLLKKYEPYIQHMAYQLYHNCVYKDRIELSDLIQEGMVGLNRSIETYQPNTNVLFYTYAKTCIDHQMYSYLVQVGRQKNKLFNESVSLETLLETHENLENIILSDHRETPEEQLISRETEKEIFETLKKQLSDMELEIFELKLTGLNYKEISEFLEKDSKVVDNTLQRIKNKLKKIIREVESQE